MENNGSIIDGILARIKKTKIAKVAPFYPYKDRDIGDESERIMATFSRPFERSHFYSSTKIRLPFGPNPVQAEPRVGVRSIGGHLHRIGRSNVALCTRRHASKLAVKVGPTSLLLTQRGSARVRKELP